MVVEIFDVADRRESTADMRMERRRGVRGQRHRPRLAERGNRHKPAETATARDVSLQYVDCAGFKHASKIDKIIAVFTRGDIHSCGCAISN